jgi:cytoskeletal protein CcmA (bactofilin family)
MATMFGNKSVKPAKDRDFTTLINDGTEIEGKVSFTGTVLLNGRVRGEIVSNDVLVVGERGAVNASIRASVVEISGEVVGNISASERIELHANCRVYGDIEAPVVVIDEGALLEGQCRMTKGRPKEVATISSTRDSSVVPLKRQEMPR